MTFDQRRILHAAKHAQIYKPSLMRAKTLDFLEVFLLQSQCRLNELYSVLAKYIGKELSEEDEAMYWAFQQDLASLQGDITTLILVREQITSVDGDFEKACKEVTAETITMYVNQMKEEEADCKQDPTNDIRSKLEKLL